MRTPSPAAAVTDALAAYRLVRLLQRDTLPPLPDLRDRLARAAGDRAWGELLHCAWCAGFHVAALVAIARHTAPRVWGPLATVLAGSAAVGLLAAAEDAADAATGHDLVARGGTPDSWGL
ncbi:DUF1360 domain-containing protein [Pseudonocardia sp. NPDC049635]|uniref:DUF1360 domain-containing protein n=1 Tax=Pseudonocardia sp. NPDC049635 TaxID=3155506 RepID=UPI0033FD651E